MANEVLTPNEVARRWRVSGTHVRALVSQGAFPAAFRVGAHIRIPLSEVERYERSRRAGAKPVAV